MCGIGGVLNVNPRERVDPQLLVNMAAIQSHRGPDGFGIETVENLGVGFCHARLSIIDLNLSRGKQPFFSKNTKVLMTHNGEFYDFQSIRANLVAAGSQFNTKSDSEILLHLYQQKGLEDTLLSLRGEFAFALFDCYKDTLYLVRDRFGVKPLYWTLTPKGVVFGSELKVLFAHPSVERKFDSKGLLHQLIQVTVPGSTAFAGIHQVKPGQIIKFKRQAGTLTVSESTYWDVNFPTIRERDSNLSEKYYIEAVRNNLVKAVELRMIADVPVACYLSGGIDSCSILGIASAISQSSIKAFTIGFDDTQYDETEIATHMANITTANQDILRLSAKELYGSMEHTLWHTERTIYNTLAVAKYLMSHHVRNVNFKVVLTGEGSDELFGGYPAFRRDMFLHGLRDIPKKQRQEWERRLRQSNNLVQGAMLASEQLEDPDLKQVVGFTPSCLQPWLSCTSLALQLLASDHRNALRGYSPGGEISKHLNINQLKGRHALDKAQYVWIKTMLEGQILTWGGDRVDMAHSVEARPAFLDHHLSDVVVQIPPELRIKGETEKHILREAMVGLLPERLYKRQKFAFMAPPAHTQSDSWAQMKLLASKYLSKEAIMEADILCPKGVDHLFARYESPQTSRADLVQMDALINHLLSIQILHNLFIKEDIPAKARQEAERLGWRIPL